jgi:hypothetical protein
VVNNLSPLELAFKTVAFDFEGQGEILQSFRWIKLSDLRVDDFTFPTDQHVAKLLIANI